MKSFSEQVNEIFEDEFFATCCDDTGCLCYERFKTNVRARYGDMLWQHDIKSETVLDEMFQEALKRWEMMNGDD